MTAPSTVEKVSRGTSSRSVQVPYSQGLVEDRLPNVEEHRLDPRHGEGHTMTCRIVTQAFAA